MGATDLEMRLRVPLDEYVLELEHATKERVIGLFGPSGCGKTTCLEVIAGLRKGATGYLRCGESVWMDSEQKVWQSPEQRGVGYVPQDYLLFPYLDVRGNLEVGAQRANQQGQDSAAIFKEVIEVLELSSLLDRHVDDLSGGERQRVALGRALCSGPEWLLLDEPLASLDAKLRQRILPFLKRVCDVFNIPILVVSHNPIELLALCDEVLAIEKGKCVAWGNPVEVFMNREVYAAAAQEGFSNVLPAILVDKSDDGSCLILGKDEEGPRISVQPGKRMGGQQVLVEISASDILIATKRLEGVSARNQLSAVIEKIDDVGAQCIVAVRVVGGELPWVLVEVTPDALEALALEVGNAVMLVFKTSSLTVY